jgi:hypothetical protein
MIFCEMQMCPEAAKFWHAPLKDEEDLKIIFDKNVVTRVLFDDHFDRVERAPYIHEESASKGLIGA